MNNFLREALSETDLFILIFTEPDEDWSYSMWELGVVTGKDTKDTRVVVMNCANSLPRVRVANLEVDAHDDASIRNFAELFFTNPEWLMPHAATRKSEKKLLSDLGDIAGEGIVTRSDDMFSALQKVIPHARPSFTPRLEHMEFRIEAEFAAKIRELEAKASKLSDDEKEKHEKIREDALKIISEEVKAIPDATNNLATQAARRFGYDEIAPGTSLSQLLANWSREYKANHGKAPAKKSRQWQDDFKTDFLRATQGSTSRPAKNNMVSIRASDKTELQPVIVGVRRSGDGAVDFSVYFFRVARTKKPKAK